MRMANGSGGIVYSNKFNRIETKIKPVILEITGFVVII